MTREGRQASKQADGPTARYKLQAVGISTSRPRQKLGWKLSGDSKRWEERDATWMLSNYSVPAAAARLAGARRGSEEGSSLPWPWA